MVGSLLGEPARLTGPAHLHMNSLIAYFPLEKVNKHGFF